jgi:uncharacterized protein
VERTGATLASSERWAYSAIERMRGALNVPPLGPGEALVIPRTRQVHTFGMDYALDVIFCDRSWNVRHVVRDLRPRRITKWVWGGYYAVELAGGAIGEVGRGDKLLHSLSDR